MILWPDRIFGLSISDEEDYFVCKKEKELNIWWHKGSLWMVMIVYHLIFLVLYLLIHGRIYFLHSFIPIKAWPWESNGTMCHFWRALRARVWFTTFSLLFLPTWSITNSGCFISLDTRIRCQRETLPLDLSRVLHFIIY